MSTNKKELLIEVIARILVMVLIIMCLIKYSNHIGLNSWLLVSSTLKTTIPTNPLEILLLSFCYSLLFSPAIYIAIQNEEPRISVCSLSYLLIFTSSCLVGPFFEELIFRHLALQILLSLMVIFFEPLSGFGQVMAFFVCLFISSATFALGHLGGKKALNIPMLLSSFLFGLLNTILYLKYGLIWAIWIHFLWNLLVMALLFELDRDG